MTALAVAFVSAGIFFLAAGAVGLIRFPDFYTRMHASGKCDTLGVLLVLIGIACHEGARLSSAKIRPWPTRSAPPAGSSSAR